MSTNDDTITISDDNSKYMITNLNRMDLEVEIIKEKANREAYFHIENDKNEYTATLFILYNELKI